MGPPWARHFKLEDVGWVYRTQSRQRELWQVKLFSRLSQYRNVTIPTQNKPLGRGHSPANELSVVARQSSEHNSKKKIE